VISGSHTPEAIGICARCRRTGFSRLGRFRLPWAGEDLDGFGQTAGFGRNVVFPSGGDWEMADRSRVRLCRRVCPRAIWHSISNSSDASTAATDQAGGGHRARGGVIAYPTDSSYALGCHIGDKEAMNASAAFAAWMIITISRLCAATFPKWRSMRA